MANKVHGIKILLIVDTMGLGGAQSVIIDFCSAFDRQCLQVLVCALGTRRDMVEGLERLSVSHRVLKVPKWNPLVGSKLAEIAEDFKPDIIYAHLVKSLIAGSRLSQKIGVPLVYHEHSDGTIRTVRDVAAGRLLSKVVWALKRQSARDAHTIIACGPRAADRMLELGFGRAEQIRVVPHGIDLTKFDFDADQRLAMRREIREEFRIDAEVPVICKVGRFTREKNWADFLRVVAAAAESHPDLRILAIGDGAKLDDAKTLAAELGLDDRVHFTGFRRDVPDLLTASDLMVYTSLRESGPIVVQEAMACGVPVATYDVGETRSMIREGVDGHVVQLGEVDHLTEHTRNLLDDRARLMEMSDSVRRRAFAEFDVRLMVRRMELVLENSRWHHARPRIMGRR
jgi:glycosyltransferase involved in cell wall biosynthesis